MSFNIILNTNNNTSPDFKCPHCNSEYIVDWDDEIEKEYPQKFICHTCNELFEVQCEIQTIYTYHVTKLMAKSLENKPIVYNFPTGEKLTAVDTIVNSDNDLIQVKLFFETQFILITPRYDTDELWLTTHPIKSQDTKSYERTWMESYINTYLNQKLMSAWPINNNQGYLDQIVFAFNDLKPSPSIVSEGSSIKVFDIKQVLQ